MIVDVGKIGPDYISGHAHSDTFSFEMYVNNKPFIVDSGVSTYENIPLRFKQKSTESHNTVQVENFEQSEIWSSFRVARRAYVKDVKAGNAYVEGEHTGYKKIGAIHRRKFKFSDDCVKISDKIVSKNNYDCFAYFHFYPNIKLQINNPIVYINGIKMMFNNYDSIKLKNYLYSPEFNKQIGSQVLKIKFQSNKLLTTKIEIS